MSALATARLSARPRPGPCERAVVRNGRPRTQESARTEGGSALEHRRPRPGHPALRLRAPHAGARDRYGGHAAPGRPAAGRGLLLRRLRRGGAHHPRAPGPVDGRALLPLALRLRHQGPVAERARLAQDPSGAGHPLRAAPGAGLQDLPHRGRLPPLQAHPELHPRLPQLGLRAGPGGRRLAGGRGGAHPGRGRALRAGPIRSGAPRHPRAVPPEQALLQAGGRPDRRGGAAARHALAGGQPPGRALLPVAGVPSTPTSPGTRPGSTPPATTTSPGARRGSSSSSPRRRGPGRPRSRSAPRPSTTARSPSWTPCWAGC